MPQLIGSTGATTINSSSINYLLVSKFTASMSGVMNQIRLCCNNPGNMKFAVYADNGSGTDVGTRLWVDNTGVAVTKGWNYIPISGPSLVAGTIYWLAWNEETVNLINYDATGGVSLYKAADYASVGCPVDGTGGIGATYNVAIQGWQVSSFFTQIIATSADVSWWHTGGSFVTDALLFGSASGVRCTGAVRFLSVPIVSGNEIVSASLSFVPSASVLAAGQPVLIISGDDSDNATAPTTMATGDAKARTTAHVDMTAGWTDLYPTIIDVKDIVKEIFERPGWSLGGALQFIGDLSGAITNYYTYGTTVTASVRARLAIEYIVARSRANIMIF